MKAMFACVLLAATAARAADLVPQYKEGAERFGQPARIYAPDYPPDALREKRGGVVEISGQVNWRGWMESPRVTAIGPTDEAFAKAVREVVDHWTFYVPIDDQCLPDPKPVVNRVEFTAEDGKPHISVVRSAEPRQLYREVKPRRRVDPSYPQEAVRQGVQATVYARIEVDAEGSVSDASARAYSRSDSPVMRSMESEVRRALAKWRFTPPADGKPWAGCYTFDFTLRD